MKHHFCPNCHKQIIPPEWISKVNAKEGIIIACGNCKNGRIKISNYGVLPTPSSQEERETELVSSSVSESPR